MLSSCKLHLNEKEKGIMDQSHYRKIPKIPVSFVEPVAREHNWNPAVLMDSAHTAEGEWATDDWSSWLNDTNTRTWNASETCINEKSRQDKTTFILVLYHLIHQLFTKQFKITTFYVITLYITSCYK